MSTLNIQFHDKIRKNWKDFVGTEKRANHPVNEPSGFEPLRLYCIDKQTETSLKRNFNSNFELSIDHLRFEHFDK